MFCCTKSTIAAPPSLETAFHEECFPAQGHLGVIDPQDTSRQIRAEQDNWQDISIALRTNNLTSGIFGSFHPERSLFIAELADSRCRGIIVINHSLFKNYFDFLTLLLRLCPTCEEFRSYSNGLISSPLDPRDSRLTELREKLKSDETLPIPVKSYYLSRFSLLATAYYLHIAPWKEANRRYFAPVAYWNEETNYQRLRELACQGNMISIDGDPEDWSFIGNNSLSILDVENFPCHCLLDLKIPVPVPILWRVRISTLSYHICTYEPSEIPIDTLLLKIEEVSRSRFPILHFSNPIAALYALKIPPTKILYANSKELWNKLELPSLPARNPLLPRSH